MPLGFDSLSRGHIPIGFFNIDTDCFLIDDHFIFASDLCAAIIEWAQQEEALAGEVGKAKAGQVEANLDTTLEFHILSPEDIGSLHGAIQGTLLSGFIGEVYKLFPFPERQEDFKQKPEGHRNREPVERLLLQYAAPHAIPITSDRDTDILSIGDIILSRSVFHQVLGYIDRGGMPCWRDDKRPDYVVEMMEAVGQASNWLFQQP